MRCPYQSYVRTTIATTAYVFWECPHAEALWRSVLAAWTAVGVGFVARPAAAVFGLCLPNRPTRLSHATHGASEDATDSSAPSTAETNNATTSTTVSYKVATLVWQSMCVTTISFIWRCRSQLAADDPWVDAAVNPLQTAQAMAATTSGLGTLCRLAREHPPRSTFAEVARLTRALRRDADAIGAFPPPNKTTYVLFIYGGSRGTSGAAGAGSVIVELGPSSATTHVRWIRSVSYKHSRTTASEAGYKALLDGFFEQTRSGTRRCTSSPAARCS